MGEQGGVWVNGTLRTALIGALSLIWGGVYLASLIQHFQVPAAFDTVFTTFVGAIMVTPRKQDKTPKD